MRQVTEALSYKLTQAQIAALNAQGMAATVSEPFNLGAFLVACAGAIVLAVILWAVFGDS
jgi:hypothetical protein